MRRHVGGIRTHVEVSLIRPKRLLVDPFSEGRNEFPGIPSLDIVLSGPTQLWRMDGMIETLQRPLAQILWRWLHHKAVDPIGDHLA